MPSSEKKIYRVVFNVATRPTPNGTQIPTTGRSNDYPLYVAATNITGAVTAAEQWAVENSSNYVEYKDINWVQFDGRSMLITE